MIPLKQKFKIKFKMFKTCIIFYLIHFLNLFGQFYCSDLNELEGNFLNSLGLG